MPLYREVNFSGRGLSIAFECPQCKTLIDTFAADFPLYQIAESFTGSPAPVYTDVICEKCSAQYEVVVFETEDGKGVGVKGHPDVTVSFLDSSYDDPYGAFLQEYEPYEPAAVFRASMTELDSMRGSYTVPGVVDSFARIFYLQHIIALEAYLSDRLIKIVMSDRKKLVALVGVTEDLKKADHKLINIVKDPDYAANTVKAYLQRFSFHDIGVVARFYKAVLGLEIFDSKEHQVEWDEVIKTRHHLVHRNGRNNDGDLVFLNDNDVEEVRHAVTVMFERIEAAAMKYDLSTLGGPTSSKDRVNQGIWADK